MNIKCSDDYDRTVTNRFNSKHRLTSCYTRRELNNKYFQRSFRSLLLSTTGGKRETTDNQFNYSSFNNKT
ncbi:unnamed protein product, partial [Rotaria sordida]